MEGLTIRSHFGLFLVGVANPLPSQMRTKSGNWSSSGRGGGSRHRPPKDQNDNFRTCCSEELKRIPKGQTYPKMSTNGVDLVLQIQNVGSFRRYCTNSRCFTDSNHTTLFHKISCTKVVRVGGGVGGGGVFRKLSGIRKILVDFSGIVRFGARNREVFWNKSSGNSAELGRIHVRNSVKNPSQSAGES